MPNLLCIRDVRVSKRAGKVYFGEHDFRRIEKKIKLRSWWKKNTEVVFENRPAYKMLRGAIQRRFARQHDRSEDDDVKLPK